MCTLENKYTTKAAEVTSGSCNVGKSFSLRAEFWRTDLGPKTLKSFLALAICWLLDSKLPVILAVVKCVVFADELINTKWLTFCNLLSVDFFKSLWVLLIHQFIPGSPWNQLSDEPARPCGSQIIRDFEPCEEYGGCCGSFELHKKLGKIGQRWSVSFLLNSQ